MGKSLIIVESPAKARTLQKYLGRDFQVKASVGHIRDLPVNDLGVDIENGFTPRYVTIRGKGKIINELKSAARNADEIYLAPDPDREGEAIAHHIAHVLKAAKKPVHRALFHEITKRAIIEAIANAGELNENLFEAQQARRILDRLVGYQVSPLLWKKVRRGLSAGRVQSVAVRMICERDEEIKNFEPVEYWSIEVDLEAKGPPPFQARVEKAGTKKLGKKGRDRVADGDEAASLADELGRENFVVEKVEKKRQKRNPPPPFITSTMQIDASRRLRFSAKRTMTLAQRLYEGIELGAEGPVGLITYMRTDSTRISKEAIAAARDFIKAEMGPDYLPAKPRVYRSGKSAQDAHEAIRPTDVSRTPEKVAPFLDKGLLALYTLIWKRFVASQMAAAEFDKTAVTIRAGRFQLKANGSIQRFPGFLSLYEEDAGDGEGRKGDAVLPDLAEGDELRCLNIAPNQHFTQPPPAYTEASLVKALEENGVGRPSTYATIISTIQDKGYVEMRDRKLRATDLGRLVNDLLVAHFPDVFDIDFTASMEKKLDQVEEGKVDWRQLLEEFYGPFKKTLEEAREKMRDVKRLAIPSGVKCEMCGGEMVIKWGKNGEFLACGNYPECTNTMDFDRDEEGRIVPRPRPQPEDSGETCEKCGRPMVYKHGRYGRFLACSGYPECRNIRAETTGVKCPEEGCDGELVRKVSKRGKVFYSCNRYPKCTYAIWDKPLPEKCPDCGHPFLTARERKDGSVTVRCPERKCKYNAPAAKKQKQKGKTTD